MTARKVPKKLPKKVLKNLPEIKGRLILEIRARRPFCFYIIAVFVSIVAFILGLFPFEKLVQNVYPLTGVLGIVLFACIFLKQISGRII